MHKYRRNLLRNQHAYIFMHILFGEITSPLIVTLEKPQNLSARTNGRAARVWTRIPGDRGSTCAARKMRPPGPRVAWRDEARREVGSRERMDSTATATATATNAPVHSPRRRASRQTAWQLADLFIRIPVRALTAHTAILVSLGCCDLECKARWSRREVRPDLAEERLWL